jgi:hypothetical protein
LSEKILEGEFQPGDAILVGLEEGKIVFSKPGSSASPKGRGRKKVESK